MDDKVFFGDLAIRAPQHPKAERLRDTAGSYADHSQKLEDVKASLGYLKEILLSDLPEEPGDYPIDIGDGRTLVVSIPEKWSWDKKALKDIYEVAGLPECVSQSFTVDRKKYEAAPDNVQEVLRKALTIECGPPSIKVKT